MKKVIKLPGSMHGGQQEVEASGARFNVLMSGCRWGKTEYSMRYSIKHALMRNGTKNWIVFPTAVQGRSVLWERLVGYIPEDLIGGHPNKTRMDIPLVNGSWVGIRGSDNESSLRGEKLFSVVLDEAAWQKPHVWEEILRPRLVDHKGHALFISSPFGKNWFYKLWEYAKSGVDKEWAAWHFTTYDNPYIDRNELEKLRLSTPSRVWRREYMGEALDDEGVVYGEFRTNNIFDSALQYVGHEKEKCGLGFDWGLKDDSAGIRVHIQGKNVIVSAEHCQNGWGVPKHASALRNMLAGCKVIDGMQVIDPSAFRREGTSMTSIGQSFAQNGIVFSPAEKADDVGVSLIKTLLEGKEGDWRLVVGDRCVNTINGFKTWEHGKHEPDCLAALRYILVKMHKAGIIEAPNIQYDNDIDISLDNDIIDPMTIFGQRRIRQQQYEDLSWNIEDGVPD